MEPWKEQLEAVLRDVPGYDPFASPGDAWLDHAAAIRAINWFADHLKHVEGSTRGKPFVLRKWQAAIVGNVFGWKRKDEQGRIVRRYRKALIFVPRGNGKTPLSAGIVLYVFFEDGESGAQCYLAAGQKEQASILFRNAAGMVDQDDDLKSRVDIYRGAAQRSLVLKDDPLSFCKTIPAEAAGQHGGIPHAIVLDELHVQQDRELLDVFETGMSKQTRAQPLLVMLTTSDYDRPSPCNEVYKYANGVREGLIDDPSFFPAIYELAADEDWKNEELWTKANPNLDVSVSRESLRRAVKKAAADPGFENELRRLHFNTKTAQDKRVVSMDAWDKCGVKPADWEPEWTQGPCYGGLDMASRGDLASYARVWPLSDGRVAVKVRTWCPEDRVKWRAAKRMPYDVWAKGGWIEATYGDRIDHREIRSGIVEMGGVREVSYDPREATTITSDLQDADGMKLVEVTQTVNNLSAATKEFLSLVHSGKIVHDGNPVLRWAVSNLAPYYKGTVPQGESVTDFLDKVPVMPSKQASADKIDPVTAIILALTGVMRNPSDVGGSVYDTPAGLVTL